MVISRFFNKFKLQEDLTKVWDQCHAHLRPSRDHLELSATEFESCPLCSDKKSIRILAHLRFGADCWLNESEILYCYGCDHYVLHSDQIENYQNQAIQWAKDKGDSSGQYNHVTAVDARLWTVSPTVLNLEPTTRCNFKCWYCIGRHMKQEDLSFEDYVKILDHSPTIKVIAIVGEGEPLLHKQFFDMVKLAKQKKIRVVSLSNGSAFAPGVVKKICESGLDYISVSIDSADPETFAQSRIGGDLDKVWAGIERLVNYRNKHGFKYPVVGLKGSLFTHTKEELPKIISEAKKRGMDFLEGFQPLNPKQSYVDIYPEKKKKLLYDVKDVGQKIAQDALESEIPSCAEFFDRENVNISIAGRRNRLRLNCDEEWLYSLLSGDVTPCCQIKTPFDKEWNLVRNPLEDILTNHHYENMRFNLWNGIFLPDCDGCYKTKPNKP